VVAQREIPGWATRADAIITLDNEVLQTGQEEVRLRLPILQSGHDPRVSHEQCGWDAGPLPSQHIRLELVSDDEAVSRLYAEELQRNIHDQWIRFPDELVEPVLGCDFDCRDQRPDVREVAVACRNPRIQVRGHEASSSADCLERSLQLVIREVAIDAHHDEVDISGPVTQGQTRLAQLLAQWIGSNHKAAFARL
jgi:hypothetical protein